MTQWMYVGKLIWELTHLPQRLQLYQSFRIITITQYRNAMMPLPEIASTKSTLDETMWAPFCLQPVRLYIWGTLSVGGKHRNGRGLCYWYSLDITPILFGLFGSCSSTLFWHRGNEGLLLLLLPGACITLSPHCSKDSNISCRVMPNLSSNFRSWRS